MLMAAPLLPEMRFLAALAAPPTVLFEEPLRRKRPVPLAVVAEEAAVPVALVPAMLASRMAWRREPRPESKLLTTVSVDASTLLAARTVKTNKPQAASAVRVRKPSMQSLLQPSLTGRNTERRCTETMGKEARDYHS